MQIRCSILPCSDVLPQTQPARRVWRGEDLGVEHGLCGVDVVTNRKNVYAPYKKQWVVEHWSHQRRSKP